jgi:hypothetical protein
MHTRIPPAGRPSTAMSRLDSFIRRLIAQRACIDQVVASLGDGLIVELGLGNGRTYDHLRERLPQRRIVVFERQPNPHAVSMPGSDDLVIGDLLNTLPAAAQQWKEGAALIHSDIGCGDLDIDRATARLIARHAPALLAEDGWLISDQPVETPALTAERLPQEISPGRYYIYRRAKNA